ncbi:MAG: phosphoenolpyruvate--protein phosphotransferase [Spirochaetaceae bacterium]|nr:MAG: phosphoenolpyruvate--protein phosphotransferase [Spirochaetaceae bacterium]
MRKNNVELIWSIGELSGLFEKRTNMGGFLQDVVDRIAGHMESDVCSIYLYDEEADVLVLRATRGLNPESVGKVHLQIGEGISGSALKELRPIREAHASKSPYFKAVPDIGEEQYESFLAVPIKRGLNRIGVMSLQHHRPDFFDVQDARAIQAIASQLAATLENVEILMEIHAGHTETDRQVSQEDIRVFVGRSASDGVALGTSVSFGVRGEELPVQPDMGDADSGCTGENRDEELRRFHQSLSATQSQLESLQVAIESDYADVASLIFSSHLLMLKDEQFSGEMVREIESGCTAKQAVIKVVNHYVQLFSQSKNARVQEKTQDVKDLGHRLVTNLSGDADVEGDYRGQIILAADVFPSELVRIAAQHAEGLVLKDGGVTAHIAILSRSLGLPVVLCKDARLFAVADGTRLLLDGYEGTVYVEPEESVLARFQQNLDRSDGRGVKKEIPETSHTRDNQRVHLLANINIFHDARIAQENRAEGIGLYRSEFPFIVQNTFPTEEEQYRIYRSVIESMNGRPVTLRTVDIGGDKLAPQSGVVETNPFLGFRGIRFCLDRPEIFRDQLRALLRAGLDADLRIMLPMVSSVDEYIAAKGHLQDCSRELTAEGIAHNATPQLGAMVELPSAVEISHALAKAADFLSIGTNDLVMYTLGVDRTNERVGHMYKPYHPAVLRSLRRVCEAGRQARCPVSICGDAAGDEAMILFLLGIGMRTFSVEPRQLPRIKEMIPQLSIRDARTFARKLLTFDRIDQIERFLSRHGYSA